MTRSLFGAIRRNLYLVLAFAVPAAVYAAILAVRGIYPFNPSGHYTVFMIDLDNQYAQFYSYFDKALTGHGSLLFTWRADGGMNFWPIVAYYLTSPFGLLTLFASDRRLPIMIAFITLLKLGTAGLGMALLLRKFRGDRGPGRDATVNKAVIVMLSTAYALGAWSLVYAFNVMWLDALYLLPWVLLGVERLLSRGRITSLAIALGLNLIIDFYTGAMICVFACMYVLARYAGVRERFERADFLRTAGRFVLAGVIGGLLAAAFIVPTYLGGLTQKTKLHADASVNPPIPLLSMLARFFGGTVDSGSLTPNVGAATLILVLVPLFFTVKGVKRAERIGFGAILAFLVLAMEVKPLYVLMHGGQMPNAFPFRFAFLITALLTFLAFRAWVGIDSVKQIKWLGVSGLAWLVVLYWARQEYPRIIQPAVVRFDALILVVGTAVLAFALYLRVRPAEEPLGRRLAWLPKPLATPKAAAVAAVAVLAVDASGSAVLVGGRILGGQPGTGGYTSTSWAQWYSRPSTSYGPALSALQPGHNEFFRAEGYDQNFRTTNDGLRYANFAFTHFSSLSSGKLHQSMQDLGFAHHSADVWSSHTGATMLTDALLGYQYLVGTTRETPDGTIDRLDTTLQKTYNNTKPGHAKDITTVYKVDSTLPVGFRLTGDDLANFSKPLPQDSPYAAQEQVFGMPGAFQSMCGSPTVTGDGLTVSPAAGGTVAIKVPAKARADKKPYSDKIVWQCQSPGARQVYLYAPTAMPTGGSYVRVDGQNRPAAQTELDPVHDLSNIAYPAGFSNGFQDLGGVQQGSFTVTMFTQSLPLGHTYNVPADPIRGLDPTAVDARLAQLRAGGVTGVHWNSTGLAVTTTGDSAATVFLSVPAIPGWTVTVDGRAVKTTDLLGSFTGVPVPAGTHRIAMSFAPPGLYAGLGGSFVGLLALGGVWWFQRRRAAAGSRPAAPAAGEEQIPQDVLS